MNNSYLVESPITRFKVNITASLKTKSWYIFTFDYVQWIAVEMANVQTYSFNKFNISDLVKMCMICFSAKSLNYLEFTKCSFFWGAPS